MPATVEGFREAFRHAPIGRWSQASGTFGAVMDEIWEFRPDHTGRIIFLGPFGKPEEERRFEWRESGTERRILLRETDDAPASADDGQSDRWIEIDYDFKPMGTDVGKMIVMFQVPKTGMPFQGFFSSEAPLSYLGDPDQKADVAERTS